MNCPNCGQEVDQTAKFCPSCGTRLEAAEAEAAGESAKYCPQCGGEVSAGAKFCPSCGHALAGGTIDASAVYEADWDDIELEVKDSARKKNMRAVMFPMLLLPVLVLAIYLLSRQQNTSDPHAGMANNPQNMAQMAPVFQQIDSLRNVLKENPKDTTALLIMAEMYEIASRFDQAQKYYQDYLSVNPENVNVQLRLANIYFNQKKFKDAETLLKNILEKEPKNAYALYNYALTLHLMGDIDAAVKHWEKAIEVDPDGEIGKQAREALQTVSMMRNQQNSQQN